CQKRPLLDVVLDEAGDVARGATGAAQPRCISADVVDPVADGFPARAYMAQFCLPQVAGQGAAAEQALLLVLEDDDFQRVAGRHTVVRERLRPLDCAERADAPVILPTAR